jgi:hypothetical protein
MTERPLVIRVMGLIVAVVFLIPMALIVGAVCGAFLALGAIWEAAGDYAETIIRSPRDLLPKWSRRDD